jgi:carboxymethylenebutenolidase
LHRLLAAVATVSLLAIATPPKIAWAKWTSGEFLSSGKPVEEHHCVPSSGGPFPAVILLHGAGGRGWASDDFEAMCQKLAEHGYYSEFIEYYSQTDPIAPGYRTNPLKTFSVWMREVNSGIDALGKNPTVDAKHIALMGFSMGSYLSLTFAVTYPNKAAAIVEYYGGLPKPLESRAVIMPPTLILHGSADNLVPVAQAIALDAALTRAGRPHEMHIYPGDSHGFNFASAPFWYNAADAADAWDRSTKFLDANLKASDR